jgi:hypothetical protein
MKSLRMLCLDISSSRFRVARVCRVFRHLRLRIMRASCSVFRQSPVQLALFHFMRHPRVDS